MKKLLIAAMVTLLGLSFVGVSTVTANEVCENQPGVGTPGYWKNHPGAWTVDGVEIGGVYYPMEVAIPLMKTSTNNNSPKADKSLTLFDAFVAAKLNAAIGNCPPDCYSFAEIDEWFVNFPVGSGVLAKSEAWQYSHGEALYECLDYWNNGMLNSPSRDLFD